MAADKEIERILAERDKQLDAVVAAFALHLTEIELQAVTIVLMQLYRKLTFDDAGMILRTPGNLKALRTVDTMLIQQMDANGLGRLVEAFVEQWESQVQFTQRLWRAMSDQMSDPLPDLKFSAAQKKAFVAEQMAAFDQIMDSVSSTAAAVKSRAVMTLGALNFEELVKEMQTRFDTSIGRARTLADTLTTNFFRAVNAASFAIIEASGPALKYVYSPGPDDAKTRPFCHAMIARTKREGLTREQIDKLDNGNALSNVWLNCGGYNCRHVWLLDTRDLEAAWAEEKRRRSIVPQLAVN